MRKMVNGEYIDLTAEETVAYEANLPTLEEYVISAKTQVDSDCKALILGAWSAAAQSNVSMGIYDQATCELCKTEIGSALVENSLFIEQIDTLTTKEDIDGYVASIIRTPLTGGQIV